MDNSMEKLLTIMAMLRDKQYGCSWDLKQTFATIAPHTLEEVYEVVECIENKDFEHLPNELGDLLFQVVFYAQLGQEAGMFDFSTIVEEISSKLLNRHPHVFPEGKMESFGKTQHISPEQVEANWEKIKLEERKSKISDQHGLESVLDDIPTVLPALSRARKVQGRAANTGFDWSNPEPVIKKLNEEVEEFQEALQTGSIDHIEDEFGDILFSLVNISRHLKFDAEKALRKSTAKFESRFRFMEKQILENDTSFNEMDIDEMERYWQKAKLSEKG